MKLTSRSGRWWDVDGELIWGEATVCFSIRVASTPNPVKTCLNKRPNYFFATVCVCVCVFLEHQNCSLFLKICSYRNCMKTLCSLNDGSPHPPSKYLSLSPSLLTKLMTDSPTTHCNFTLNLRGTNSTVHPQIHSLSFLFLLVSLSASLFLHFPSHINTSLPLSCPWLLPAPPFVRIM